MVLKSEMILGTLNLTVLLWYTRFMLYNILWALKAL